MSLHVSIDSKYTYMKLESELCRTISGELSRQVRDIPCACHIHTRSKSLDFSKFPLFMWNKAKAKDLTNATTSMSHKTDRRNPLYLSQFSVFGIRRKHRERYVIYIHNVHTECTESLIPTFFLYTQVYSRRLCRLFADFLSSV